MELLTKKEVADKCRMTEEWVTEAIDSGKIPSPIFLDGNQRWRDRDIEKWIEAGCPSKNINRENNVIKTDNENVNLKTLVKRTSEHWPDNQKERGNKKQDIQQCLLTVKEASRYLCICERKLFSLTKEKLIPAVRMKRAVRYDIKDLDKYIESAKENHKN